MILVTEQKSLDHVDLSTDIIQLEQGFLNWVISPKSEENIGFTSKRIRRSAGGEISCLDLSISS